jgi:4-hydroxybenzoate polyprenyltransferase
MVRIVCALFALLLLALFLGFYIVRVSALPLWIIIVATLLMFIYDIAITLRRGDGNENVG